MKVPFKKKAIASAFVIALCVASFSVEAADPIGQVKTLDGKASVMRDGANVPLAIGSKLFQKDTVSTGMKGQLGMTFIDNSMFSVGPDSELSLEQFRFNTTTYKGAFKTKMNRGTLAAVSGKIAKHNPGAMNVKTPSAILGVRGTKFVVEVEGE